jgi:hypothetical protein
MQDYQIHLEGLRKKASEAALISNLATRPEKQELFANLSMHLQTLAYEIERAMLLAQATRTLRRRHLPA